MPRSVWQIRTSRSRATGDKETRERGALHQTSRIEISTPDISKRAQGVALFKRPQPLKRLQSETAAELDPLLPIILDRAFKGEL